MGITLIRTAFVALVLLAGPGAAASAWADPTHDPGGGTLETINRYIFGFNRWVAGSFGTVSEWDAAVSPEIASAMGNFFANYVNEPTTLIAGLTAGDGPTALHATKRFLINTTLGFGGVFDAAAARGLPAKHLDWGLGACAQGVSDGPFVVIPMIGPRTSRDAILDVLPAQAIVFYGTHLLLGPFIGMGGVVLLQLPELFVEVLAFRQMDLEATGINADNYDATRDRYIAYRQRRCQEYKAALAQRRAAPRSGPRIADNN